MTAAWMHEAVERLKRDGIPVEVEWLPCEVLAMHMAQCARLRAAVSSAA
jgi:hypothetical protein